MLHVDVQYHSTQSHPAAGAALVNVLKCCAEKTSAVTVSVSETFYDKLLIIIGMNDL